MRQFAERFKNVHFILMIGLVNTCHLGLCFILHSTLNQTTTISRNLASVGFTHINCFGTHFHLTQLMNTTRFKFMVKGVLLMLREVVACYS